MREQCYEVKRSNLSKGEKLGRIHTRARAFASSTHPNIFYFDSNFLINTPLPALRQAVSLANLGLRLPTLSLFICAHEYCDSAHSQTRGMHESTRIPGYPFS